MHRSSEIDLSWRQLLANSQMGVTNAVDVVYRTGRATASTARPHFR